MTPRALFVGLAALDLVYLAERAPRSDEKVVAERQLVAAGGPAANAAVAFARLGGAATLLTAVGAGVPADAAAAELASRGVEVRDAAAGEADVLPVSSIVVTAGTGERAVVSRNAGRHEVAPPEDLADLLSGVGVVVLDGHHPRLCVAAALAARAAGVPVLLDAGSWKPVTARLLPLCQLVVASADFRPPGGATTLRFLVDAGAWVAAVSRGPSPIRWAAGGDQRGEVPVPAVTVVDTLGAGDVLHGAFAYAVAVDAGRPRLPHALEFAAEVASLSCSTFGTREWLDHTVPAYPVRTPG